MAVSEHSGVLTTSIDVLRTHFGGTTYLFHFQNRTTSSKRLAGKFDPPALSLGMQGASPRHGGAPAPTPLRFICCPSLPRVAPHFFTPANLKSYPPQSEPVWGGLLLKMFWAPKITEKDNPKQRCVAAAATSAALTRPANSAGVSVHGIIRR